MIRSLYDPFEKDAGKIERKKCPFYGFYCSKKVEAFIEGNSNQCPLLEGYAPCQMEISRGWVDWDTCELNSSSNLIMLTKAMQFKFFLKGEEKGLDFEDWIDMVMK